MNQSTIKEGKFISRDFFFSLAIAFMTKLLIEGISSTEEVTSIHLSVMTTSSFILIRTFPFQKSTK